MTKCLKCIIKKDPFVREETRWKKCKDCSKGINPVLCEDCGSIQVYCTVVGYYHDGDILNTCPNFNKKLKGGK